MIPVNMPVVGQDIPTGIIKEWLKKEGDPVMREEVIATVESEKAVFDVESPTDGILIKIVRQEEEEVEVLTLIAYIGAEGETYEEANAIKVEHHKTTLDKVVNNSVTIDQNEMDSNSRIFSSPLARKIARNEGIELKSVQGTGPEGRIIKRNILDAAKFRNTRQLTINPIIQNFTAQSEIILPSSNGENVVQYNRIHQLIADKLTLSKKTVPHFYLFIDVETDNAIALKLKLKSEFKVRVTITDIVIYAVAKAIVEFPLMNSHVYDDRYIQLKDINIGLAVSSEKGLIVPIVKQADKVELTELAVSTRKLSSEAKKGKMDPGLKTGLTISSLGMFGVSQFLPIINPPECAIIGVGQSSPKVVTDGKNFQIKNMMTISLACDHRLIDGVYAANFINMVKEIIENAEFKKLS